VNPGLLEEMQVLECVGPLVSLIAKDYALQQFEGLLALTNLATVGMEVQDKIVGNGFGAIEELQWSKNEMVVRAATELLCNCVSCDKVLASIKDGSRQKLWIGLALSEDPATANAAAGAIAMASGDPRVAASLAKSGAFAQVLDLAESSQPGMRHRAFVTLENLRNEAEAFRALDEGSQCKVKNALERLKESDDGF